MEGRNKGKLGEELGSRKHQLLNVMDRVFMEAFFFLEGSSGLMDNVQRKALGGLQIEKLFYYSYAAVGWEMDELFKVWAERTFLSCSVTVWCGKYVGCVMCLNLINDDWYYLRPLKGRMSNLFLSAEGHYNNGFWTFLLSLEKPSFNLYMVPSTNSFKSLLL